MTYEKFLKNQIKLLNEAKELVRMDDVTNVTFGTCDNKLQLYCEPNIFEDIAKRVGRTVATVNRDSATYPIEQFFRFHGVKFFRIGTEEDL